jgi:hypothetical protein
VVVVGGGGDGGGVADVAVAVASHGSGYILSIFAFDIERNHSRIKKYIPRYLGGRIEVTFINLLNIMYFS